jgi:hypothetical protein
MADHASHGLETVVAPNGVAVPRVAVQLRWYNLRDEGYGERDWTLQQRDEGGWAS